MLKGRKIRLAAEAWLVLMFGSSFLQGAPVSGIYRIDSGTYVECCGIAGQLTYGLPNQYQTYVHLTIDNLHGVAGMSILWNDMHTVFTTLSGFAYSFTNGVVFPDYIQFGDPSMPPPKPGQPSLSYTISNSTSGIQINGMAIKEYVCCDMPNEFAHTNVLATLARSEAHPRLSVPRVSTNGSIALTVCDGQAGQTNVIEASSELVNWDPISTNVFPPTLCPTCPFINFEDSASTNFPRRYYRCYTVP
jgi:hypothetical protein